MPAPTTTEPVVSAPEVDHRLLRTTFKGLRHSVSTTKHGVNQFRGIKYANIPARFRRSKLVESYPPTYDATKHGPISPQPKVRNVEQSLFGLSPTQYPLESFVQNEFECLNLNITTPASADRDSKFPVMLWVHGGGNTGGAGSRWLLDGGNLVRRSLEIGKPLIIVALNYRLGLFGFAASPALATDNARAGDKGVGNYGLHDQLNALRWIHKHISEFGGDPSHVTVCGEGKGAIDVHALLLAGVGRQNSVDEPKLVHRAILQSGTCPPTLPRPSQQFIELSRVMYALHVQTIDELRQVPAEELVDASKRLRVGPTDDGSFFPTVSFDLSEEQDLGVEALLIGDTHNESYPYAMSASLWTSNSLAKRIKAVLRSPYKSDALLRAFEVSEEDEQASGCEELAERIGELIGDCLVAYGVERLANILADPCTNSNKDPNQPRTKVYRFTFDQPSPFNSSAHHAVDLVYLFGNIDFDELASESREQDAFGGPDSYEEKRVCEMMQRKWIEFIHGEEVWGEYIPPPTPPSYNNSLAHSNPPSSAASSVSAKTAAADGEPDGEGEIYIFGPTGDTYPAPVSELGWRRRVDKWKEGFEEGVPGGLELGEVVKVGMELANGPTEWGKAKI